MSYSEREYVDGGSNPSILLVEAIIQSILLPLNFLSKVIVLAQQWDEISLELKQFNHQGHHFEVDALDDDLIGIGNLPQGDVDVYDLLGAQFRPHEFDHIEIFFVDCQDAASMDVSTHRMKCHHFSTHAQLPFTLSTLLWTRSRLIAELV